MQSLGLVTIGQSPRVDLSGDMFALLPGVRLVEAGALDGMSYEAATIQCGPGANQPTLVSRMQDGRPIVLGEKKLLPYVCEAIGRAESAGVAATLIACSGQFPELPHAGPLFYPDRIVESLLPELHRDMRKLGVLCPDARQVSEVTSKLASRVADVCVVPVNPYSAGEAEWSAACDELVAARCDWIFCDCIGYSRAMAQNVRDRLGMPVVAVRSLVARVLAEWLE